LPQAFLELLSITAASRICHAESSGDTPSIQFQSHPSRVGSGNSGAVAAIIDGLGAEVRVEKKVAQLPPGPLFWCIDSFATLAQAETAAGPTALAANVAGKTWGATRFVPGTGRWSLSYQNVTIAKINGKG